ncbi:MAG: hypothetical protein COV67_07400 [Nitrospinae bacterium CG11_big_fil_rev_8_21_14_0_20_56_8]|nr:MAG: hypothetical protein COV67_07400 [Nitrospinae bacterium CG11_big_fil_rev_8_21_14_0_20_56_8]
MNKDQIAIYLNEHPEFFNEYPELLRKVKNIDESQLPIEPLSTLSIADRIIKRVHDDKEHLKSKLAWFVEVVEANEKIHEHLFEIERVILKSGNVDELVSQLRGEMLRRFEIGEVRLCLVDTSNHFMEHKLKERYPDGMNGTLRFICRETAERWFNDGVRPVLRGEVNGDSQVFNRTGEKQKILSEALIPIPAQGGGVLGAIALGSLKPLHFYDGLRTEYLERMAEKIGIAIGNILMIKRMKHQCVVDRQTGFLTQPYLDPALKREFELARETGQPLSCLKLHIDYYLTLLDSFGEAEGEKILEDVGKILSATSRTCDILVRTDIGEFILLLPGKDSAGALRTAESIRQSLRGVHYPNLKGFEFPSLSIGIATFPCDLVETHEDLLQVASKGLADALEEGGNRLYLAPTGS